MQEEYKEKDLSKQKNNSENMKDEKMSKGMNIFLSILTLGIIFAIGIYFWPSKEINHTGLVSVGAGKDLGKMIYLIMGVDDEKKGNPRSDTIILAFVNTYTKKVQLLSIPRDTKIFIEGKGDRKINSAFRYGGVELTKKVIVELLHLDIDGYFTVNIDGFVNIINILGGVKINVEDDMYYVDKAGELYIDIKKGEQVLDGRTAMYYVRYRDKIYADIGRIKRQQKFIKEILRKIKDIGIIWKIPSIIQEIYKNINTDLGIKDVMSIVKRFRDFDIKNVQVDTLPGEGKYINKVSYFVVDYDKTQKIIEKIMRYEADKSEKEDENRDTEEITKD
ncbi:MAG: hypothetical protein C0601_13280 [Candidatus Muiribacterium halophilum]|uniref:Cell envelope-related transcriptional attenuator domain-containing protein n=1 Tax=Muiribacterium halophilum TaxID=2053465 RepID=A0A2N5Z9K3_MUIH1|nr:MAG: hypothetical protein C0601_13280 [Candidatus Muirbacterium halophilum]